MQMEELLGDVISSYKAPNRFMDQSVSFDLATLSIMAKRMLCTRWEKAVRSLVPYSKARSGGVYVDYCGCQ